MGGIQNTMAIPIYRVLATVPCDRLESLIYLGWELLCVAYIYIYIISVLHVCVKAISILSASFFVSPILHFEIERFFSFTCLLNFCAQ